MSLTRLAARLAGCLAVFVIVIAAYNVGAYLLVQKVISQTGDAAPLFPATNLEINFDGRALEGLHDGYYNYQPERERPGHRFGDS